MEDKTEHLVPLRNVVLACGTKLIDLKPDQTLYVWNGIVYGAITEVPYLLIEAQQVGRDPVKRDWRVASDPHNFSRYNWVNPTTHVFTTKEAALLAMSRHTFENAQQQHKEALKAFRAASVALAADKAKARARRRVK